MKRARQALRRLYWIDAALQRQAIPNAVDLAAELGVSSGTIRSDIARLRERFKAPVIFDPSLGGYYYGKAFTPALPDLPAEDALALAEVLGRRGPLAGSALLDSLDRLAARLRALLPGAAPISPAVEVAPAPPAPPRRPRAHRRLGARVRAHRDRAVGPVTLQLRFDRSVVAELLDEGFLRRKDVQFLTDGGIEAAVKAEDPEALLLDLLRWAPHFEIAHPAWVRRRLPMLLHRLLRYWEPRRRRRPR